MNLRDFIKEKLLITVLLFFSIITIEIFLLAYHVGNFIRIYIPIIIISMYLIGMAVEYCTKRSYYNNLLKIVDELEEKYLITEIIKSPNFIEGKILKDVLEQTNKSMIENVNKYKYMR